jgi:hypothetical protein
MCLWDFCAAPGRQKGENSFADQEGPPDDSPICTGKSSAMVAKTAFFALQARYRPGVALQYAAQRRSMPRSDRFGFWRLKELLTGIRGIARLCPLMFS